MSTQTDLVYRSQRRNVLATRGMVATSQPLAAQAGLDILRAGGNAADAAQALALAGNGDKRYVGRTTTPR